MFACGRAIRLLTLTIDLLRCSGPTPAREGTRARRPRAFPRPRGPQRAADGCGARRLQEEGKAEHAKPSCRATEECIRRSVEPGRAAVGRGGGSHRGIKEAMGLSRDGEGAGGGPQEQGRRRMGLEEEELLVELSFV